MLRFQVLIILFIIAKMAAGEYTHPQYRQYTLRDGLSQMQVTGIIQDSRGYIWIATKEGLNCYNGDKFQTFQLKDGLPDNYINSLTEDSNGNIWVSTRNGLAYFDGKDFKSLTFDKRVFINLTSSPDGKIWYAGRDNSGVAILGYIENGNNHDLSDILPAKTGNWFVKYARNENAVILTNFTAIFEYKNNNFKEIASSTGSNEFSIFENESTVAVFDYSSENVRIDNILEYRDGELVKIAVNTGNEIKLIRKPIENFITPHPYFHLLIKYDTNGLQQLQFDDHTISAGIIDKDSTLWLGTEEGLIKVIDNGFETYKREYLPVVWSMVEDNKQNIWFASYNFGIRKYDGKNITEFETEIVKKYASGFNFQAQTNGRGKMYFPNNRGIFYTDGKAIGKFGKSLSLATYYDLTNDLLYSGCNGYIEVYDKNHHLLKVIDANSGLGFTGFISSFGSDSAGNLWFGGFSCVSKYRPETGKIENYNAENGKLTSGGIVCIYTDPAGTIWFGGTSGLYFYNVQTDSIQQLNFEEITGSVNFVTSIDTTWLIFSQSKGVYFLNLQKYLKQNSTELYFFNEQNGFLGIEPGQNGAMIDSKRNIWMTTSTEVVKLDPRKLKLQNYFGAVRFSGFNGETLAFSQNWVELPKNERSVVIAFDAICFSRPNPVQYSWKLENDTVWSDWQEENYAVVTNLPDGKTELQVRARVPGLPGSLAQSSLFVKVSVAMWKQAWFFPALFGFFAVLTLFVFVLFVQTRTKMIQTSKQAKAFQVKAIQSQMNPHFIFNVLASFQTMILSLNVEKANQYLVKLASLVRGFLDASTENSNSGNDKDNWHPIQKEIELIEGFVDFQQLIYPGKFNFILNIAEEIDVENEAIPPMILQPFIENAIRHGLLPKDISGNLWLRIDRIGNKGISITIEDDGIGIEKAGKILNNSPFRYESKGSMLTLNRIKLMNELGYQISVKTQSSEKGTIINIRIPKNDKGNKSNHR